MPDFAPNYTARYKLRYSTFGAEHTMQFRFPRTTTALDAPEMVAIVTDFLTELESILWADFTVLSASFALADTDIFLPIAAPSGIAGTVSTAGQPVSQRALSGSFPGRSEEGLRAIVYVYGLAINPASSAGVLDFRLLGSENANIAAAVAVLNASSLPTLVANDNTEVTWYNYCNVKYNDYWVGQIRG